MMPCCLVEDHRRFSGTYSYCLQLQPTFCLVYSSTLMMDAVGPSVTSANFYQTTSRHIREYPASICYFHVLKHFLINYITLLSFKKNFFTFRPSCFPCHKSFSVDTRMSLARQMRSVRVSCVRSAHTYPHAWSCCLYWTCVCVRGLYGDSRNVTPIQRHLVAVTSYTEAAV
jgi:hypothetical protein